MGRTRECVFSWCFQGRAGFFFRSDKRLVRRNTYRLFSADVACKVTKAKSYAGIEQKRGKKRKMSKYVKALQSSVAGPTCSSVRWVTIIQGFPAQINWNNRASFDIQCADICIFVSMYRIDSRGVSKTSYTRSYVQFIETYLMRRRIVEPLRQMNPDTKRRKQSSCKHNIPYSTLFSNYSEFLLQQTVSASRYVYDICWK